MDKYTVRRMILDVVIDCEPACAELSDILAHPTISRALETGVLTQDQVIEGLKGLTEHGFLKDFRPGRAPLIRITAAGRDQIKRECDLQEYIWGEHASKFQA